MRNIYKYYLPMGLKPIVQIHAEADILSIQFQEDNITIWAMVNTDNSMVDRQFYILGTGHGIPEEVEYAVQHNSFKHISTVQKDGFVWHIFENTMPF